MRAFKSILGFVLALAVVSANAIPTTGDESGSPGGHVTVSLTDSNANILFGMVINFAFDPNVLTLQAVRAGSLWIPFPAIPGVPVLTLLPDPLFGPNAQLSGLPIVDGTGPLLHLDFLVNTIDIPPPGKNFPFETPVTFECEVGNNCSEYPFDLVTSMVTIDRATGIPLPGTLPLLAVAVAALYWTRRRIA